MDAASKRDRAEESDVIGAFQRHEKLKEGKPQSNAEEGHSPKDEQTPAVCLDRHDPEELFVGLRPIVKQKNQHKMPSQSSWVAN